MNRLVIALGVPLSIALAGSPALVARLFSADGVLEPATRAGLQQLQLIAFALLLPVGILFALAAHPLAAWPAGRIKGVRHAAFATLAVLLSALVSFALGELLLRAYLTWWVPVSPVEHRLSANPRLAYEQVPSSSRRVEGVTYTINARGFRGPEWPAGKPCEWMVVGDSLVFGDGVDVEDTFWRLMDRELAGAGRGWVAGIGVRGYSTFQERELIRLYAPELKPRWTIVFFCMNDVHDPYQHLGFTDVVTFLPEAIPDPTFSRFYPRSDAPAAPPSPLRAVVERALHASTIARYLVLEGPFRTSMRRPPPKQASELPPNWGDYLDLLSDPRSTVSKWLGRQLADLAREAASAQRRVAVVVVPLPGQLIDDTALATLPQNTVRMLCENAGLPVLDLTPFVSKDRGEKMFLDTAHFSKEGHRVVARAVSDWIAGLEGGKK